MKRGNKERKGTNESRKEEGHNIRNGQTFGCVLLVFICIVLCVVVL